MAVEAHEEAVDRRQQQRRCGRVEDRRARPRVIRVVVAEPLQHCCDLPQHRLIVRDGPHGRTGRATSCEGAAGETKASNVHHNVWPVRGELNRVTEKEPLHLHLVLLQAVLQLQDAEYFYWDKRMHS